MTVEWRWAPIKRIKDWKAEFYWGKTIWAWAMLSSGICVWFFLNLFLFTDFNQNLLTLRIFNITGIASLGSGHWLFWFMAAVVIARHGWANIFNGLLILGIVAAWHEPSWYIAYFIVYPSETALALPFYAPFLILLGALAASYHLLKKKGSIIGLSRQKYLSMVVSILIITTLWTLASLPVTIDLVNGPTSFFSNLSVSLIENSSWVVPLAMTL